MQYHHLKLPNRSAYSKIDCRLTFAVLVARHKQHRNWETAVRAVNEAWRDHFGKNYCELDVKAEDLDKYLPSIKPHHHI